MFELDYVRAMQNIGYMNCWTLHVVVSLSSLTSKTLVPAFLYSNNLIKLTVYHALNGHHNVPSISNFDHA